MFKKLALTAAALFCASLSLAGGPAHAIAMHGSVKYPPSFKNFDYVNPDAPKGGTQKLHALGTFDSLNPFILKGVAPSGIGRTFDTLMTKSADEPFTMYGLVAQTIETPPDRSWVKFTINPKARFNDGKPITPEDVIFTFETLRDKGHPFYRSYYGSVKKAAKEGELGVKFTFSGGQNRELPLILGEMPVLPKHYFAVKAFDKTTLEPLLGSGPYKIEAVDAGRSVTYKRVKDYWGASLPVNVGQNNFDAIRIDYYRDQTVALEAFKAGEYDFRAENTAKTWATGYDFPAAKDGRVLLKTFPNKNPSGMQGFAFNTRKEIFKDPRVRRALAFAFDFESANKQFFYESYTRTRSYFDNSEMAATGLPSGAELEILNNFKGKLPEEIFTKEYNPPSFAPEASGDANKKFRENLLTAKNLLEEAGWKVADNKLTNAKGEKFAFEILLENPAFERIALPFTKNLEKLGIEARVRTIDPSQYENRMESFDFDMAVEVFGQSLSPGNEQRDFWSSGSADVKGSRNVIGIKDPVVDELVEMVISAKDRDSLVAACRALDRVLQWSHYVIPHWHISTWRLAFWNKFGIPKNTPPYDLPLDAWWSLDPSK